MKSLCFVAMAFVGCTSAAAALDRERPDPGSQGAAVTEALNLEGTPVRLHTVEPTPPPANVDPRDFRAELAVENRAGVRLDRLDLYAFIYSPSGAPKGGHGFTLRTPLPAGVTSYVLYSTSGQRLAPGDRVVVYPWAAYGKDLRWNVDPAAVTRLAATFGRRGEAAELDTVWSAATNPPEPGVQEPRDRCQTECATAQVNCSSQCPCGMSNHSCACSDEHLNLSCSCYQCPPQPGGGG